MDFRTSSEKVWRAAAIQRRAFLRMLTGTAVFGAVVPDLGAALAGRGLAIGDFNNDGRWMC
jgi:hypothetical protein